jgi:O-antigen ligase
VGGLLALDLFGVRARAGDFLRLERDGRVGLWLVAWAMFRESPWLGKGVFTFGEYYRPSWYAFRVAFPAGYIPEARIIPWAHNLVLEMLSERGVAGLASFVYLIGSAAASCAVACASRAWRRCSRRSPGSWARRWSISR